MPRTLGLTRVAIVEDHRLFAESLEIALTLEGHDVTRIPITEGRNAADAVLAATLKARPRVVLLDLDLGAAGTGIRLIRPLVRAGAAVVVVTSEDREARWGECLAHGAQVVLDKGEPLNTILATIRRTSEGRTLVPPEERVRLIDRFRHELDTRRATLNRLGMLTPREQEVLRHLMAGRPVREIAQHFVVSEATVRTQVKSVLSKMEVTSQLAAVGAAHRAGWRPDDDEYAE